MTTTPTTSTVPKTAHAIRVHAFGGNEQLAYEEVPVVSPGEGEVLIQVAAAGVNPVDWKIVRGFLSGAIPATMPFVPGWDLSGTVVQRGHGARRFAVGDAVYGYVRRPTVEHGTYAEYVTVPECYLAEAPTKITLAEAAGIPLAGLTAYQCLHDAAGLRAGETVLVLGASGGVGAFGVQLAKVAGAKVCAVASAANRAYCTELGADQFVAYDSGSLAEAFAELAGRADVILDCSGRDTAVKSRPTLAPAGRVVSITTRTPPPAFEGTSYQYVFVEPSSRELGVLARLVNEGKLTLHLQSKVPLAQVAEAFVASEGGHTRGKVVLVP